MSAPRFGVFLSPDGAALDQLRRTVATAEAAGVDYVSLQDHPYVPGVLDTFSLVTDLAARTSRLRFMTNVANLPLRPAPMLAKASASIDVLSGGRFDLGLGGGHAWDRIAALGGPRRTPAETVTALEDAIDVLRTMWEPGRTAELDGTYPLHGADTGPAPAHPLGIWLGARGPRMLRLLGRKADGWIVPIGTDLETARDGTGRIDAAARSAGRDPAAVERVLQPVGVLDPHAAPLRWSGPPPVTGIRATADDWVRLLLEVVTRWRVDAVNLIPQQQGADHVRRFAEDVVPRVRDEVGR
jgi:alkanesulfonate monooxygenase SsuD/methylene tetrahydromethanopterin reductase-like flavin-dependent oxidoreductase (luciferase family)